MDILDSVQRGAKKAKEQANRPDRDWPATAYRSEDGWMSHEYPSKDNIAFVSTGDAAKDDAIAEEFILHEKRLIEGICPNGCGPMVNSDAHNRDCPVCKFHQWSNAPIGVR